MGQQLLMSASTQQGFAELGLIGQEMRANVYDEDAWARGFATNSSEPVLLVASDMATPGDRNRLLAAGAAGVISQLRFAEDLVDYFRSRTKSKTSAVSKM